MYVECGQFVLLQILILCLLSQSYGFRSRTCFQCDPNTQCAYETFSEIREQDRTANL